MSEPQYRAFESAEEFWDFRDQAIHFEDGDIAYPILHTDGVVHFPVGCLPRIVSWKRLLAATWFDPGREHHGQPVGVLVEPEAEMPDPGEGWRLVDPEKDDAKVLKPKSELWIGTCWTKMDYSQEFWVEGNVYRVPIEPEPRRAKVGDWVRCSSGSVFQVNGVFENHVSGEDAGNYCSATHGCYEMVRRTVRPWTRSEAMKALADIYAVLDKDGLTRNVSGVTDRGLYYDFANGTGHIASLNDITNWTLPNGEPCGVVEWNSAEDH